MRFSAILTGATLLSFVAATPVQDEARLKCTPDACLSGLSSAKTGTESDYITFACTQYLDSTALVSHPATTTTITPVATSTVYNRTTTVTHYNTIVSETRWATTINSEVYSTTAPAAERRAQDKVCQVTSTYKQNFQLASVITDVCPQSTQFVSACKCLGFATTLETESCSTVTSTLTAPPKATVTKVSTSTDIRNVYVTESIPTPLVDKIRCGDIVPLGSDLPAYVIVCEAQGTGNRTIKETVTGTDWDNCAHRATWTDSAYSWEFDIAAQTCYIYNSAYDHNAGNKTIHRKDYVFAYIY